MYILIIEDDKLQFETIQNAIKKSRAFSTARIERIVTESEFRSRFEEIASNTPDAIILDIMLRWADPAPDMPLPPPQIAEQGFYRAGVRCQRMLADDSRTKNIPIVVYTILENEDLLGEISERPQVSFLEKYFDPKEIEERLEKLILGHSV